VLIGGDFVPPDSEQGFCPSLYNYYLAKKIYKEDENMKDKCSILDNYVDKKRTNDTFVEFF
jgi:hypothetical protein